MPRTRQKPNGASNGVRGTQAPGKDLPPSTIADQIVRNHNHGNVVAPSEHQAIFAQLLEDVRALPSAIESDVESNFNLIEVLVEACLDPLKRHDPFSQREDILMQAHAGLDVIDIAIQRSPNVLCYSPGLTTSKLHVSLLPRFLSLAAVHGNQSVQTRIGQSLTVWLHVLAERVDLWMDLHTVMQSFQSCLHDLLERLVATERHESQLSDSDVMNVNGLSNAEALPVLIDTLVTHSQFGFHSENHAVLAVSVILESVLNFMVRSVTTSDSSRTSSAYFEEWMLVNLTRYWQILRSRLDSMTRIWNVAEAFQQLWSKVLAFSLYSEQNGRSIVMQQTCVLLVECVSFGLSQQASEIEPSASHSRLRQSLSLLTTMVDNSSKMHHLIASKLYPQLEHFKTTCSIEKQSELYAATEELLVSLEAPASSSRGSTEFDQTSKSREKRRKISQEPVTKNTKDGTSDLSRLLHNLPTATVPDVVSPKFFLERLVSLEIGDQRKILDVILGTLRVGEETTLSGTHHCQAIHPFDGVGNAPVSESQWLWFAQIIYGLVQAPFIQSSNQFRVLLMMIIGAYARHRKDDAFLTLTTSKPGQWCLKALGSSVRELRIAARQTLVAFLKVENSAEDDLSQKNRMVALDVVRQLCNSDDLRFSETSISTLGLIGSLCNAEELIFVLEKLVHYLGHKNNLICGLAHLELENLAEGFHVSTDNLLKPYWQSLAINVVKDIMHSPQKCQQVSDLLGISVNHFLQLTQADTIPYLVLWGRRDVLQKFARIRGKDNTIWAICMQPRNLTAILSLLITQQPPDLEAFIVDRLSQASSDFKHEDLASLMKIDPIPVACEVLKLAGDENQDVQEKVNVGFRQFTMLAERGNTHPRSSKTDTTALFFTNHALGIMTSFANMIDGSHSVLERRRCLRAVKCMIQLGGETIVVALPQIRACLQSAFKTANLRDDAFSAWTALLAVIKDYEYLRSLLEDTFASTVQHWNGFSSATQHRAYDLVASLLKQHSSAIQDDILMFPALTDIPMMSKFEAQLEKLRSTFDQSRRLLAYETRCQRESSAVVLQTLRELLQYLEKNQQWVYEAVITDPPNPCIATLVRTLLDVCLRFSHEEQELGKISAQCLGIIGCLDQTRVEAPREHKELIVLSNFDLADEAVDFVAFMLENVLVKAFNSVSNPRAQGFLAYVMQELLKFCGFSREVTASIRHSASPTSDIIDKWWQMPESVTDILKPFLTSKYVLTTLPSKYNTQRAYPIYSTSKNHGTWLRDLVFDLLLKAKGDNATIMFTVLSRVIRGYDVSIASFLLPFAVTNVVINGTEQESSDVVAELLAVLGQPNDDLPQSTLDNLRLCSENVFEVLDYLSRWLQAKRKALSEAKDEARRQNRTISEVEETSAVAQISTIENVLSSIPADVISRRAVECGSYSRALLHWELHMREQKKSRRITTADNEALYLRLQEIYSQIDEPDGLEGISAHIQDLPLDQQALEHRRAGRWAVAQSWYELELVKRPDNADLQANLLDCLREGGQYHAIAEHVRITPDLPTRLPKIMSIAAEAGWRTESWAYLEAVIKDKNSTADMDFNTGVATAMLFLRAKNHEQYDAIVDNMRSDVAKAFSNMNTSSLQASHDQLLKLHALYDMEVLGRHVQSQEPTKDSLVLQSIMSRRLDVFGAFLSDKQYILGIRRAVMRASDKTFGQALAASWMTSATLARKSNAPIQAYEAVVHALELGDGSAKIEQARLLWRSGEHNKAIQSLEGIIATGRFGAPPELLTEQSMTSVTTSTTSGNGDKQPNILAARAHLLLAKWLDQAGSTQFATIIQQYQTACKLYPRWEKGFYYLGKYYNKLLDAQKAMDPSKQSIEYLSGLTAKHVVENYLRSLTFGCKYLFETLPKLLTLWLDAGMQEDFKFHVDIPDDVRKKVRADQPEMVKAMNKAVKKYTDRITSYIFYTALAQMITRICHPAKAVWDLLSGIILKVLVAHPQQALWPLLAVVKSSAQDRASRGSKILGLLKNQGKTIRHQNTDVDSRSLIQQATKMSDQLLRVSDLTLGKDTPSTISLTKTLGFNIKTAPCPLVVPCQKMLSATLPSTGGALPRGHKAFPESREAVTIQSFSDEVLVMSSLQKPRKVTIRGSDGVKYAILCKPKDDLRKDQRLMEFNSMINRGLKKDAEASKRRLGIRTYAVTPLNEECGLLEWVDGLKPIRDILVGLYKQKGMRIDYVAVRELLDKASAKPVTAENVKRHFTDTLLPMFPPVLHEWFLDVFADPEAWFAARLRYARSAAVTSVVYHALGLGDRHGENVLLERSGAVFHVDFNCLFEKGLTFDKPELVPFRLTHNMVDALGAYGVDGPFRRSAHQAMRVLRAQEDALLTIIETFVYDPTTDFVGPPRKRAASGVPQTPKEVLESVKGKIEGYLRGESVPLSVEGYVDALIRQATDPANLAGMYIGWCAFF